MFVIGVGTNLRISELNQVASDPDDKHVFLLKNGFRDLSGFVDQMSTTSCDGRSLFNPFGLVNGRNVQGVSKKLFDV